MDASEVSAVHRLVTFTLHRLVTFTCLKSAGLMAALRQLVKLEVASWYPHALLYLSPCLPSSFLPPPPSPPPLLRYIDSHDIVQVKGRVACAIASADEVVVTELFFTASLADLPPEVVAALLSCCVWQVRWADGRAGEKGRWTGR